MPAKAGTPELFATQRYAVLKSVLAETRLTELCRYVHLRARSGKMKPGDEQAPGTPSAYGDLMMDRMLAELVPVFEKASGLELFPTYSYFRLYKRGDVLKRHADRPACEVSVSLCLGQDSGDPWPLAIEGPMGTSAITLAPGDALMYRGTECPHWRDAFVGDGAAQVFLHYVDQNGPHREWKFDKRGRLA